MEREYQYPVDVDEPLPRLEDCASDKPVGFRDYDYEKRDWPPPEAEVSWHCRRFWVDVFTEEAVLKRPDVARELRERARAEEDGPTAQEITWAWRVTRRICRVTGLLSQRQTLLEALDVGIQGEDGKTRGPWSCSLPVLPGSSRTFTDLLHTASEQKSLYLLPPEPETSLFLAWLGLVNAITQQEPVFWLGDPVRVAQRWPKPEVILAKESAVLAELGSALATGGRPAAREAALREGLSAGEVREVLDAAEQLLADEYGNRDVALERGLLLARLDALYQEAREAIDLRTQLGILKTVAVVSGVTRAEGQDAFADVVDVVAELGGGRPRQLQEPEE